MTNIDRRLRRAVLGLALAATPLAGLIGCGGGDPDNLSAVPAAGTVKLNGTPLEKGTIQFAPAKGRAAHGTIEGGKFTLTTQLDGDGAVPGKHQVAVVATKEVAPQKKGREPETVYVVPEKFASPGTSGLSAEVPAAGKKDIEININTK